MATEEERTSSSKRKRQFHQHKQHGGQQKRPRKLDLRQHGRGVLVTAGSANYTREALQEALKVIREQVLEDHKAPVATSSSSIDSTVPAIPSEISAEVETEIAQLKEDSERFIPIDSLTKGVCFIQFSSLNDEPNELVRRILEKYAPSNPFVSDEDRKHVDREPKETEKIVNEEQKTPAEITEKNSNRKRISCRFMNRLVPTELTCSPHISSFKRAVGLLIRGYFPDSALVLHPEDFEQELKEESEASTKTDDKDKAVSRNSDHHSHERSQNADSNENDEKQEDDKDAPTSKESKTNEADVSRDKIKAVKSSFSVPKGASWSVQYERRAGMKTLDRDIVIEEVGRMVGGNYTVNLSKPEYSVVIEVNNIFCGMSVVRDFSRLLKYNIHRLCHPEQKQPKNETTTEKQQQKPQDC